MKEIKAYIKPHKLNEVILALHKVKGLTGMSVTEVRGFGRGKAHHESHHGVAEEVADFQPHLKIEIACTDELVDTIVSVIEKTARTGLRGDGKIYVSNIDAAIRISTGERGDHAV